MFIKIKDTLVDLDSIAAIEKIDRLKTSNSEPKGHEYIIYISMKVENDKLQINFRENKTERDDLFSKILNFLTSEHQVIEL